MNKREKGNWSSKFRLEKRHGDINVYGSAGGREMRMERMGCEAINACEIRKQKRLIDEYEGVLISLNVGSHDNIEPR